MDSTMDNPQEQPNATLPPPPAAAPPPTLMRELGFTAEDLTANRAGMLSEMQHYQLRTRRRRSMVIGLCFVVVVAFIASGLIFVGGLILTLIGVGVTVCGAALMGLFARHWLRLTADIQGRRVRAHQGPLERVIKPVTRRVLNYMIRVDGAEVFISKEAFDLFQHQQHYAIYRAPATGTLLSAEQLET